MKLSRVRLTKMSRARILPMRHTVPRSITVARSLFDGTVTHPTITVSLSHTTRNIVFSGGFSIRHDIRSRYKYDAL